MLDDNDEDVKNLLITIQSDSLTEQQQSKNRIFFFVYCSIDNLSKIFSAIRSFSSSKRTRYSSKASLINDRNNEFIFDEEHLLELLKRLKQQQQSGHHNSASITSDDESNLFDTLISKEFLYEYKLY